MKLRSMAPLAALGLALTAALPAMAAIQVFTTTLSGAAEAPPNASPGTGNATVTIDDTSFSMRVQATFLGLTGLTTRLARPSRSDSDGHHPLSDAEMDAEFDKHERENAANAKGGK